jgi:protease-4
MFKKFIIGFLAIIVIASLIIVVAKVPDLKNRAAENGKIAIIYVDGLIMGGRGQTSLLSDYGGTDNVIRQLHDARDDATVRVVVLRINSPGGSVPATQEVGEEIKKLRASGKMVVASMGDIAASGGYWLAAVTDRIYANPATLTGSIGVYMPYANWEELFQKIGVRQEKIKSGLHKDILSPDRPMTEEERRIIQIMVDEMYDQFVGVVAEGRKMDPGRVRQLADGRIYTGSQAKELGLVDELGNLYDAIDGAAKMAGLQGKPVIKEYGKMNPLSVLFGSNNQLDLNMMIPKQLRQDLPLAVPLALPAKWGE